MCPTTPSTTGRSPTYGIDQLARKHDKPFFLAVGLHKPHLPWNVPKKYFDLFPLESIQLPPYLEKDLDDVPPAGVRMAKPNGDHAHILASGRWKEAIQAYLASIAYTDMNIGRLLDALDKSAYRDNTIICLWGDHGWHLGEKQHWRKFALWEETTRAPLIWVAPGVTKPGTVCERTIDFMTIYPTLTDLCGIPTPKHVEGASVRSLLADPKAAWAPAGLTTYKFKNHAVRVDGWRYIRYENGDEELYDETADPNEWKNLAKDPAYAAKKAELAARLPTKDHEDIGGTEPAGQGKQKTGKEKQKGGKNKQGKEQE
jgi:arylsulfatase A-like enzyme